MSDLQKQNTQLRIENTQIKQENQRLKNENKRYLNDITAKDIELQARQENEDKNNQLYEKTHDELRDRNQRLLDELKQQKMRADDNDIKNKTLLTEMDLLQKDKYHQVNLLEQQLIEARKALPKADIDYLNQITYMSTENDRLRKQLKDKGVELDSIQNSYKNLDETRNQAIQEMQRVQELKLKVMEEQIRRQATSDLEGEVNQLRTQLDMVLFENDNLKEKLQMIQDQTSKFGTETLTANKDAAYWKQKYQELEHLQENKKIFQSEKYELIRTEVRKQTQLLHREVDEMQRERDLIELEMKAKEAQVEQLRRQLQNASRQKREIMERHAKYEAEKCQVEKDALRMKAHSLEDELDRVRKQMIKERQSFPNIEELKYKYEQQIADMKRQRDNWESRCTTTQKSLEDVRATVGRNTNNKVAEIKLDELKAHLKYYEDLVPKMDDELAQLKKEIQRLNEVNARNKKLLGEQDYDIAQLQKEIQDHQFHKDTNVELKNDLERAHKQKMDFEIHNLRNIEKANAKIDELMKEKEELAKRLLAKGNASSSVTEDEEKKQMQKEIGDLQYQIEELEMDIGILIDERKFMFSKQEYTQILNQRDAWKEKYQKVERPSKIKPNSDVRATAPPQRSRSPNFGGNV